MYDIQLNPLGWIQAYSYKEESEGLMESELTKVYIGLGLLFIIGVAILVLQILIYINLKANLFQRKQKADFDSSIIAEEGIVFCKNCGNQRKSTEAKCPYCQQ